MVKKTPKTENNETRDKFVHIAFTKSEKERYQKVAKESGETLSNFIRLALEDKVRVIENPSKYKDITSNESQLREIRELQMKQIKMQELLIERMSIVNGMNETISALKPLVDQEEMKKMCSTIISMLKVHKALPIKKVELLTGFEKGIIYDCIAANDKLIVNESDEVVINE